MTMPSSMGPTNVLNITTDVSRWQKSETCILWKLLFLDSRSTGFNHPNWAERTKKHWDTSRAFHDTILWETHKHTPPRPAAQLIWCLATWPSRLARHHGKPPGCSLLFSLILPPPFCLFGALPAPVWYLLSLAIHRQHRHSSLSQHTGAAEHD